MNNARITLNKWLRNFVLTQLADLGFKSTIDGEEVAHFFTGDETYEILFPSVSIFWIMEGRKSTKVPGYRMSLCQLEVETTDQATEENAIARERLMTALGIREGDPIAYITLYDWSVDPESNAGKLQLHPQGWDGWKAQQSLQRQGRRYVLTLETHYQPT